MLLGLNFGDQSCFAIWVVAFDGLFAQLWHGGTEADYNLPEVQPTAFLADEELFNDEELDVPETGCPGPLDPAPDAFEIESQSSEDEAIEDLIIERKRSLDTCSVAGASNRRRFEQTLSDAWFSDSETA